MTLTFKSDFWEGRVTKILNFGLKIKEVVGRVAHAKSSDPATSPKFETCTRVGANFWCKSPGVRGGGWLWMKLIPALTLSYQMFS